MSETISAADAGLVSVILPTYNRAETLARAIRSVLIQTHTNLEFLVVDDGSTDSTESVVRSFSTDARIFYHRQTNQGAGAARNRGIALAHGDWIAFQDSDDEWLPHKLSAQLRGSAAAGTDFAVIYSDMLRIRSNGAEEVCHAPEVTTGTLINSGTCDYQAFGIGIQTALIRRQELLSAGGLDPSLPRFIDLDLFTRLALTKRFLRVPQVLVRYFQTHGITSSPAALAAAREQLLRKHERYFNAHPRFLACQYLRIAEAYWKVPNCDKAARFSRLAFRTRPFDWRIASKVLAMTAFSDRFVQRLPTLVRRPFQ